MNKGYIKLNRSILDWEWYHNKNTKDLFIHCLLRASWEDKTWNGVEIKKGQFVTSIRKLANELQQSVQHTRTALSNLQKTHEITLTTTPKYTIITVNAWDKYQLDNTVTNKQTTQYQHTDQHSNQHQYKKTKENKENNNIYIRAREEQIIELYKKTCVNLKPILKTANYSKEISKILYYMDQGYITEKQLKIAFEKANKSDYLCGKGKDKWQADMGWILKMGNLQSILNGKYDNAEVKDKLINHNYDFDEIRRLKLQGGSNGMG